MLLRNAFSLSGLFIFVSYVNSQFLPEDLIVEAGDLGPIRGRNTSSTSESGAPRKDYIQFLGIPYATFPARFKPSELKDGPLNPTGEPFEALYAGMQCWQPSPLPFPMTEDCLFINVYTEKKYTGNDNELRPVIFFIHGGAFTVGAGNQFSPIRLMNRDIVYVSINYRLGLAGFFSLQNEDLPGNAGMYDVVNALKWVQKYIKFFGGNPDLVTIAGQSAGSVTVTQLLASPLSQGLFHRAIGASGSALNEWGTTVNPMADSLYIAERAGCYDTSTLPDFALIGQCMRGIPAEQLVDILYQYQVTERRAGRLGFAVVSPIVQDFNIGSYPRFLEQHPEKTFENGSQANVPLMMGATKHDGSYVLGVVYNRFLKDNNHQNDPDFLKTRLVPAVLESLGIQDNPIGLHESLSKMYLDETRYTGDFDTMFTGLIDLFSVFFFKGASYKAALMHSKLNSSYWYSFDFRGSTSLFASLFAAEVPPFPGGVTHTDDLIYIHSLTFSEFNNDESAVSSRMLDYWANFAKTGDPTPVGSQLTEWPELQGTNQRYMVIDRESSSANFYSDAWVGAGDDAARPPATTSTAVPTKVRITSTSLAPTAPGNTDGTTSASTISPVTTEQTNGSSSRVNVQSIVLILIFSGYIASMQALL